MRKVTIATPCYGGAVCVNHHTSTLRLFEANSMIRDYYDIDFDFETISGESLITRARNELVARFLESDATDLFWIDADIGFDWVNAVRLVKAPYPVVGGVYRLKGDDAGFAADPADVGEIDADGFAPIREVPTGFMRIKREVFETLIEHAGSLDLVYYLRDGGVRYRFFDTMLCPETDEYLSEDYAFCRRCEAAGIPIYVDTRTQLEHQGIKRYTGDFSAAVRAARSSP